MKKGKSKQVLASDEEHMKDDTKPQSSSKAQISKSKLSQSITAADDVEMTEQPPAEKGSNEVCLSKTFAKTPY